MFRKFVPAFVIACASVQAAAVDDCSKELLLAYFPEPFLLQVLKNNGVPEKEWAGINEDLMAKDRQVVALVEAKAAKMDPNPLTSAKYRPQAVELFRQTLYEIFGEVLRNHGVTDETEIQAMLDDIQYLKAERFQKCMQNNLPAVDDAFQNAQQAENTIPQPDDEDDFDEEAPGGPDFPEDVDEHREGSVTDPFGD